MLGQFDDVTRGIHRATKLQPGVTAPQIRSAVIRCQVKSEVDETPGFDWLLHVRFSKTLRFCLQGQTHIQTTTFSTVFLIGCHATCLAAYRAYQDIDIYVCASTGTVTYRFVDGLKLPRRHQCYAATIL